MRICITMSSRESIDALEAAAARRAARPAWHSPAPAEAEPSTEAPPPGKPERAEDTFDWNAKPGPAKYAAFMDAFPPEKYCSLAYPRKTK